ncbi:MAG TPA: N-methyl-L-tryptophan oxidase [Tepidisphaeraceae bacterium]
MTTEYDAIVIGVGAMGSACCYHLARRGARVLGIERFGIPNALGSSHGFSRMIRMAYYEHADYVPLLRRAFALWEELERESREKLFYKIGGIYMGRPTDPAIAGALASARVHGLPHELLSREELRSRYPQFHVPEDVVGMFEENAGLLVPEKCVAAHARLAREAGAEIHPDEEVVEWGEGWVKTVRETYRAKQIVFTAGPWTSRLVRELGVKLEVTRQVLGWVTPRRPELFELGRLPVWAIGHADGSLHYGFPMLPDGEGFKLAWHRAGEATDPDLVRRETSLEDEEEFRTVLREIIPDANGPLRSMRICLYTNSPDHHFVIDRLPGREGVIVACGFSGHGFKFASVVGEVLADLVTRGKTDLPVEFLKAGRFSAVI